MSEDWHRLANPDETPSPALLIYPDRVVENIRRMIAMAGTADRLRPHVKTHKLGEIVQLQLKAGITRFKCATIAEAEMLAQAGARDVLIANQLVGSNARRWPSWPGGFAKSASPPSPTTQRWPATRARTGGRHHAASFVDLDGGMGRSIPLGQAAITSISSLTSCPASNRAPPVRRAPARE